MTHETTTITLWGDNVLEETGSHRVLEFTPDGPIDLGLDDYRVRITNDDQELDRDFATVEEAVEAGLATGGNFLVVDRAGEIHASRIGRGDVRRFS